MFIGNSQKEARYLSFPVSLSGLSPARFKITADILIAFADEFFYRRNRRHRVTIMLFKLKSVLYPPDATVINRRRYKIAQFFLAVAYEHCITMKHLRFGDKIETSLNLFFFIYFQASEFSRSAFGCYENSDPKLVSIDAQSYPASSQSLRATIGPLLDN